MDTLSSPVYSSLTKPILVGGAPREIAILNLILSSAAIFGLHALWSAPLFLIFHIAAVALAKDDPDFVRTLTRHIRSKPYYEA